MITIQIKSLKLLESDPATIKERFTWAFGISGLNALQFAATETAAHALVQDAAYVSLVKKKRAELWAYPAAPLSPLLLL